MDSVVIALFLLLFCLVMGAVCSACDWADEARRQQQYWDVYRHDVRYLLWAVEEDILLPNERR